MMATFQCVIAGVQNPEVPDHRQQDVAAAALCDRCAPVVPTTLERSCEIAWQGDPRSSALRRTTDRRRGRRLVGAIRSRDARLHRRQKIFRPLGSDCQPRFFENTTQPPLLGVVKAANAVSARILTCRAPAVPLSCSMLSVYMAVRVRPFPRLPPLEQKGCGPSTRMSPA